MGWLLIVVWMPMESILVIGINKHKNEVPKIIFWDIFLIRIKAVGRRMPWLQMKASGTLYLIFIKLPLALVNDWVVF